MDFQDLYLFVGPPMTRGPPPLPLVPSLLPPPPPVFSSTLLPPTLPRPPSSWSKNPSKQRLRLKPYHRLKPSERPGENQVRPQQGKALVGPYGHVDTTNAREVQMIMSDLELDYRTTRKDWQDCTTPTDVPSPHAPGDPMAMWTTVLDMSPQFLALDPVVGDFF
ncbi:hypothetical protein PsorP6_011924 [Peronosclerospora sorghi]|uniref:Uncharacterized protein n=1 Tax=Peronosclerospora sorghi TaxID=230839 RepID=A0ACC0WKA4_9STRA|nr:hypothetical protein PsorP6_011924 [Peronosclerospora sorghi]